MRCAERVVLAFRALGEARQPAFLAQRANAVAPPGQDLVRIALVADVPDQLVGRRVEDRVDRDRQLDHPQRRPEMPAGLGDCGNHFGAQLVGQPRQLAIASALRSAGPETRSRIGVSGLGSWSASAWEKEVPRGSDSTRHQVPVANRKGTGPGIGPDFGPGNLARKAKGGADAGPPGFQAIRVGPRGTSIALCGIGAGACLLSSGNAGLPKADQRRARPRSPRRRSSRLSRTRAASVSGSRIADAAFRPWLIVVLVGHRHHSPVRSVQRRVAVVLCPDDTSCRRPCRSAGCRCRRSASSGTANHQAQR